MVEAAISGSALILLLLCGFLFAALPWLLAGSELPEDAMLLVPMC